MTSAQKIVPRDLLIEDQCHQFTAFASDLGWRPGEWPASIQVDGLGNKRRFVVSTLDGIAAVYRQELGCLTVTVFND